MPTNFLSTRSSRPAVLPSLVLMTLVFVSAAVSSGCRHFNRTQSVAPQATSVSGRVVYAGEPNRGVPGVTARAVGKSAVATTDSTGWFMLALEATEGEFLQLSLTKPGYDEVVTTLNVHSGAANVLASSIPFTSGGPTGGGSGGPANSVVLKSISATDVGVAHAGVNSTALIVFEVQDSQGQPLNYGHRVTVQFSLSQNVGGGATLTPDTMSTDEAGRVSVALTGGTLAQSVQVRAQVASTSIYSDLVPVAIRGGLPDASHFSFAAKQLNIPGLVTYGTLDPVTAFVGDRYGNPVQPGTVVYFTTTAGIIQGSALTDSHGRATVDLVVAAPLPPASPQLSDSAGTVRIAVQTMDQNQVPIVASARAVMFSGHTQLAVTPTAFNIPASGAQDFAVTIRDSEHHNPLAPGTTITVTATHGTLGGEASVTLPDTWDPAYTTFNFRLENAAAGAPALVIDRTHTVVPLRPVRPDAGGALAMPASAAAVPATIRVDVSSPNGGAHVIIYGTLQ